ncbi:hypothetical protein E4T56_gene7269 [Termitomyces sp. T112]|nr:hypothetical protein E4T56_gene7269 [Termitomyces sp. T112]
MRSAHGGRAQQEAVGVQADGGSSGVSCSLPYPGRGLGTGIKFSGASTFNHGGLPSQAGGGANSGIDGTGGGASMGKGGLRRGVGREGGIGVGMEHLSAGGAGASAREEAEEREMVPECHDPFPEAPYTTRQTPTPPEPPDTLLNFPSTPCLLRLTPAHYWLTPTAPWPTPTSSPQPPALPLDFLSSWDHSSAMPDPITHHQLNTLASPTYPGVSQQPQNRLRRN